MDVERALSTHLRLHVGEHPQNVVPAAQLEVHLQHSMVHWALQLETLLPELLAHVHCQVRLPAFDRAVQQRRERLRMRMGVGRRVGQKVSRMLVF